jgi:ferredoxin
MESVKADLAALGVPPAQVHTELFIAPETRGSDIAVSATAKTYSCVFQRANKSASAKPGHTVLETAEENGVAIDYSCRQGFCGVCKVKLLEGSVSMAVQDGLSSRDRASQVILACQAIPETDVKIDA